MSVLELLKQGQFDEIDLGDEKRIKIAEGLTEFPRELFEIAEQIEVLDMSGNSLSDLPVDFGRFKNLRILFFADNRFEHVPEVISKCEKLEMLGFKNNRIKTVAENALPNNVHWLILTGNEIQELPNSIGKMVKLRKLALAGNKISMLPDSMRNCRELELVRLSANSLTTVPDWLFQLPKLTWLALSGNPVTTSLGDSQQCDFDSVDMSKLSLNKLLGQGASGLIYHANHSHPSWQQDDVAVKVFKGDITSDGYPKDEILCCLQAGQHKNLIPVLAKVTDAEKQGLVMELIPSHFKNLGLPPSLQTCTRDTFKPDTTMTIEQVLKVVLQMAETVQHLHKQAVSHGDVYAHNTMICDDHNVLFGDFGAATDLSNLSDLQKEAMEKIEVRALGCLLDDLLSLVLQRCSLHDRLSMLSDQCMTDDMAVRLSFQELLNQLRVTSLNDQLALPST